MTRLEFPAIQLAGYDLDLCISAVLQVDIHRLVVGLEILNELTGRFLLDRDREV